MKTNVIHTKRMNPYSKVMEDFSYFIEITNNRYKPVTEKDKYFCITFKEMTDNIGFTPFVYNVVKNKELAEIMRIDIYLFHHDIQEKYQAVSDINGGHYFLSYEKAKKCLDDYVLPQVMALQLMG